MRTFSRLALATSGALLLTLLVTMPAQALEDTAPPSDKTVRAAAQEDKASAKLEEKQAKAAEERKKKLEENKLRVCQKREQFVVKSMDRLNQRSTKQLELFDNVTTRLQNYVTTNRLTVTNYDALLSDVEAKKTAAKANLSALQTAKSSFKCDVADPKAAAGAYQTALRNTNKSLKDYRDALKKLLVGIKSAQAQAATATDKAKP